MKHKLGFKEWPWCVCACVCVCVCVCVFGSFSCVHTFALLVLGEGGGVGGGREGGEGEGVQTGRSASDHQDLVLVLKHFSQHFSGASPQAAAKKDWATPALQDPSLWEHTTDPCRPARAVQPCPHTSTAAWGVGTARPVLHRSLAVGGRGRPQVPGGEPRDAKRLVNIHILTRPLMSGRFWFLSVSPPPPPSPLLWAGGG